MHSSTLQRPCKVCKYTSKAQSMTGLFCLCSSQGHRLRPSRTLSRTVICSCKVAFFGNVILPAPLQGVCKCQRASKTSKRSSLQDRRKQNSEPGKPAIHSSGGSGSRAKRALLITGKNYSASALSPWQRTTQKPFRHSWTYSMT